MLRPRASRRQSSSRVSTVVRRVVAAGVILPSLLFVGAPRSSMSIAYGTLNNFDCVNDTGVEAHGFDIEIEDCHSSSITYTYDWSHYGVPKITEDSSDPLHPRVLIRYASAKKPDGTWAAYTAIPSGPISPTDGHQFTDPSVNFGGEHFGVGYYGNPSLVKYYWLIDDGAGNLVRGPLVNVATPSFNYYPPAAGVPANVVAVIPAPPPPPAPVLQFGEATFVKAIKTTTHNPNKVRLQDLVSDDPGNPEPWANGEPEEVEMEWRLMQTQFGAAGGGANGELEGGPEELPDGDEVITRRYEFYKYIGPFDAESGEAMASEVAADGIHGVGTVTYNDYFDPLTGEWVEKTVDLSTVEVVGEFFGAQMSGFDVAPALGLIDNVQEGEVGVPFPDRLVVIAGGNAFLASISAGALPPGMALGQVSGVLSGTPTSEGVFTFTVEASDFGGTVVSKEYSMTVVGEAAPPTYTVATSVSPAGAGVTGGGGSFALGDEVTVTATRNVGYYFQEWTENSIHFSFTPSYTFNVSDNRSLLAVFGIDNDRPTTSAALSGPAASNGWFSGAVEVTLNPSDALSGIASVHYQVDAGAPTLYAGPFTISSAGAHSVSFWSEDKAGNIEVAHSEAVNIDGTAPSMTATPSKTRLLPANDKMVPVVISGTVTDGTSGVDLSSGSYSTVDSYGLLEPSGAFTVDPGGTFSFTVLLQAHKIKKDPDARTYTLTLQARDNAGNTTSTTVVVSVPNRK